jgi:hypothetical protein
VTKYLEKQLKRRGREGGREGVGTRYTLPGHNPVTCFLQPGPPPSFQYESTDDIGVFTIQSSLRSTTNWGTKPLAHEPLAEGYYVSKP